MAAFVAMFAGTMVSVSLPTIVADLGGSQDQYSWVVAAALLTATAAMPLWGGLADQVSKKLLVQAAISIFVLASILAGFSQDAPTLIAFRLLQGVGMGGLQVLVQIVLASLVPHRARGRYLGHLSAVMAVATVSGPVLGGLIADASSMGWRWCFWICAPLAVGALVVLQRTLDLPVTRVKASIDWLGALLIPGGVAVLLLWMSMVDRSFGWLSFTSVMIVVGGVLLIGLAVLVEHRVSRPILPPRLMRRRTMVLVVIGSVGAGGAMVGALVFLGPYFQIAHGRTPSQAGLLMSPMMLGLCLASTVSGRRVSRSGGWKMILVAGTALMTGGLGLMATIGHTTPLLLVGAYMTLLGAGVGATMQTLLLAGQDGLDDREVGAGSASVAFSQAIGGATGVLVIGAVTASRLAGLVDERLGAGAADVRIDNGGAAAAAWSHSSARVRQVVAEAYGDAAAASFLVAAALSLVALVAVIFLRQAQRG
ncbi:MFS transporter [Jiangella asiatica]|uniref:MFS transporter n=1 Tax=Jiangella asiatica TaxID=2530372 RepID=A0A4V6PFN6_9ACTN|nr:MFS transporter [Jiangella asiatica]TDE10608.1 MFS transporter [Jiangella asiatica]